MKHTNRYNFTYAEQVARSFLSKMAGAMSIKAYADTEPEPTGDPTPTPTVSTPIPSTSAPTQSPTSGINLEDWMKRIRKEEKDKLYGQIQTLKEEVKNLRESNNGYIIRIAEYQKTLEEAQKEANPETVQALNDKIASLETELEEAKKSAPNEEEIRAQIEKEFNVKMYAKDKIAANKENILSIFEGEVTGTTEEEVDKAIEAAIEKSNAVKKDLGLVDDEGNPVTTKVTTTPTTPTTPQQTTTRPHVTAPTTTTTGGLNLDPAYIRSLDPHSDEFKEIQKQVLGKK